jgi:hypothetical protein
MNTECSENSCCNSVNCSSSLPLLSKIQTPKYTKLHTYVLLSVIAGGRILTEGFQELAADIII